MKKKITFYYTDDHELHLCKSLSIFANKNGFQYEFSDDLKKDSSIGFYCQDSNRINLVNSKLSIITLGGPDQGKLVWPNLWSKEPWNKFDLAFLPGEAWKKKWEESSWDPFSRPKISMNLIGWPKTELIFNNKKKFKIKKKVIKKRINFPKNKTIIYAPGFEMDGKALTVINIVKDLGYNLIIKHHGWAQKYQKIRFKDLRNNIKKSNNYAKKVLKKRVYIVNPSENIMDYYNQANLLITDESSVIYESLLFDLPSLCVKDWKMSTNNSNKPRLVSLDESVCFVCFKKDLRKKVKDILNNTNSYQKKIIKKKFYHFSYLENSSKNFYKLIDVTINSKKNKFKINPKYSLNYIKFYLREIFLKIFNLKNKIRNFLYS